MRSIFWKIFLSFWLAMALILGLMLKFSMHLSGERSTQASESRRIDIFRSAEDALESGGAREFEQWLKSQAILPPARTVYLLDQDGQDILGRSLPNDVESTFKRQQQRRRRSGRTPRWPRMADADGNQYWFLFGTAKPPLLGVLSSPGVTSALFLVALLVSALICFLLTRYLTAPLTPVMAAARKLSTGDLDARVGKTNQRSDELGDLSSQFDQMADALQRQVESRQDLLRNVSHELRSPIARILVALELASRQPDEINLHLQRIAQDAEHMEALTQQILDLAKAHASPGTEQALDLQHLVRQICDDAAFEGKPASIFVEFSPLCDHNQLQGNEALLSSAIENVVRNALRFSPPEAIVRVTLDKDAANDHSILSVVDEGPGISPALLSSIFDPFVKGSESDGAGVGLALSRQIVELHGGQIKARNNDQPEKGLTVTMTLPHRSTAD
ncbi:MAG: ATP-binding protein [Woeseiaceae bacterium]